MSHKNISQYIIIILIGISSSACYSLPGKKPSVVIEDAHSGGSIVAFNAQSTRLASGGWAGVVKVWTVPSGKLKKSWQAHSDSVNGIYFYKRGSNLVTAGYDGYLKLWTLNGRLKRKIFTGSPIMHMNASWKLNRMITGHKNGRIIIWNLDKLKVVENRQLHRKPIRAVAINERRGLFASSAKDGRVYVWRSHRPARRMTAPPTDSRTLEFTKDGHTLMGGGWFKIYRWRVGTGKLAISKTKHMGIVKSMQLSKDGQSLATISRQTDSSIYILNSRSLRVKYRLESHNLCGAYIRYSPNSRFIATTSDDASIKIFDLTKIKQ